MTFSPRNRQSVFSSLALIMALIAPAFARAQKLEPVDVEGQPLAANVGLYRVVNGQQVPLAEFNTNVTLGQWQTLRAAAKGDRITCYFDGKQVIDQNDDTFKDAGKFGVWTKADSIIQFDDLTATPE